MWSARSTILDFWILDAVHQFGKTGGGCRLEVVMLVHSDVMTTCQNGPDTQDDDQYQQKQNDDCHGNQTGGYLWAHSAFFLVSQFVAHSLIWKE